MISNTENLVLAIREAGWPGAIDVFDATSDGRPCICVRWGAREVYAVDEEAAAIFIRSDTRAKAAALTPDVEVNDD